MKVYNNRDFNASESRPNEDEEGVFSEYIPTGIDCFTGFFYLDEANGCMGLDYLKSLIYGYESDGITRINRRQQEYTRTFYQDTDYDGYHWTDELELFIADLSAFNMDCRWAHVAFGSSEFNPEYVPIGSIRPTLDSLYIFEEDLKIFLMGLRGEQEEQLAAFNDDELGFDGKRGSATIIDNDETPKSEKKPLVRMKKGAKNMNVNSPKVRKMLEAMSEYQCDGGYSIDFGELWEQSEDKFGYADGQRASARKAYYKRFEKIEHPTTANVE